MTLEESIKLMNTLSKKLSWVENQTTIQQVQLAQTFQHLLRALDYQKNFNHLVNPIVNYSDLYNTHISYIVDLQERFNLSSHMTASIQKQQNILSKLSDININPINHSLSINISDAFYKETSTLLDDLEKAGFSEGALEPITDCLNSQHVHKLSWIELLNVIAVILGIIVSLKALLPDKQWIETEKYLQKMIELQQKEINLLESQLNNLSE